MEAHAGELEVCAAPYSRASHSPNHSRQSRHFFVRAFSPLLFIERLLISFAFPFCLHFYGQFLCSSLSCRLPTVYKRDRPFGGARFT